MSKLVCINKLIHMFTHFGFATQKRIKKCPLLMKLLPDMMIIIYDDMRVLSWDEEEDANVQKSNGKNKKYVDNQGYSLLYCPIHFKV